MLKKLTMAGFLGVALFANISPNAVVAVVDGKKITANEVNQYLRAITGNPQISLTTLPAPQRQAVIRDFVTTKLLYQQARRVTNTPTYRILAEKLAINIWAKELAKRVKVTENEIRNFYNQNKAKFKDKNGKYVPYQQVKPFIQQLLLRQKVNQQIQAILNRHKIQYYNVGGK
jgi:transcription initiation factor TFIIIB Brf1 subunit/transcription initiation factor TFIIB